MSQSLWSRVLCCLFLCSLFSWWPLIVSPFLNPLCELQQDEKFLCQYIPSSYPSSSMIDTVSYFQNTQHINIVLKVSWMTTKA
ncbi:predicted protein [Lichtheimia corymbifera JMRC:FSU:9682]|uniref:Uncharacterized protein n=1 Tax=Lichtheimia corymbifera JMRC:FSU:9682 TaxID=1263082 RepID=A0A068RNX9_9FUNG|nr:predicted protein [Lichtheimia corymbifera JMRC:FSU:9682]